MRYAVLSLPIATILAACASTPSAPSTGSPGSPSCADLATSASAGVHRAIDAHRACTTDAECVAISVGASCFDHCSTVMNSSGRADVETAKDQADVQCHEFLARGCKLIPPPCMAPPKPRCRDGSCG